MPRDWGPWTVIKLETLEKYFSGFTTASKYKAKRTLYLDLFGGRPENRERETQRVFPGSAMRAALADPPFTRLIVTELDEAAAAAQREALDQVAPGRATVVPGDCNSVMLRELDRLPSYWRYAPTFALIDQFSAEIAWSTLRRLATWKADGVTKIELCLYFGESFIVRGLHAPNGSVNVSYAARLDAMYGSPDGWRMILAARDDGELTPAQTRAELVNLMRWRLEHDLGYATTLPLQVRNTVDRSIFSLIFATDHDVGDKIMRDLFEGAEHAFDQMVARSKLNRLLKREEQAGLDSLFGAGDLQPAAVAVEHPTTTPPVSPFEYSRLWDRDRV